MPEASQTKRWYPGYLPVSDEEIRAKYDHHLDLPAWRMADLDMNFSLCDKGEKGFLATREARKMLINMGIPIATANAYTKKRGYYTFKELIDKCQEIINEIAMLRSLYTAFRYTDIKTSDVDRYTGFVDYDFVATKMEEHGMMEDEIDLFLAPYHRDDGKLEYQRLLRDTFPGTYTSDLVEVMVALIAGWRWGMDSWVGWWRWGWEGAYVARYLVLEVPFS